MLGGEIVKEDFFCKLSQRKEKSEKRRNVGTFFIT